MCQSIVTMTTIESLEDATEETMQLMGLIKSSNESLRPNLF